MSTCRRHCGSDNVLSSPQARTGSVSIDINSDAKVKKRRSGDLALLGLTAHRERFARVTLIGDGAGCYLKGPLARVEPQVVWRLCHDKAVAAANERWREFKEWQESSLNICTKSGAILSISWNREDEDGSSSSSLEPGMSKARKFAIQFFLIEVFCAPEEEDWAPPNFHPTLSLPAVLLSLLDISSGSRASVLTAMRAFIAAHAAGETYDPSAAIKDGRGAKAKIEDLTPSRRGVQGDGKRFQSWEHRGSDQPVAKSPPPRTSQLRRAAAVRLYECGNGTREEGDNQVWEQ